MDFSTSMDINREKYFKNWAEIDMLCKWKYLKYYSSFKPICWSVLVKNGFEGSETWIFINFYLYEKHI